MLRDCFSLSIYKDDSKTTGWRVQTIFTIGLHEKDIALLENIQKFFMGVGKIYSPRKGIKQFRVSSIKELQVIVNHFDKYPLITKKRADFELFKLAINLIENKKHLTPEGLKKIVSIRASINLGLTDELKKAFSPRGAIIPTPRPFFPSQKIYDPQWLIGFIDGEGCFIINIQDYISSKNGKTSYKVWLTLYITQHIRDIKLMESIIKYLDCGRILKRNATPAVDFKVGDFNDIITKIIPFLQKHPLQSVKQLNYQDWVKASSLIANKEHLTAKGLEEIKMIKNNMNKKE
jgi:hypothetical protein